MSVNTNTNSYNLELSQNLETYIGETLCPLFWKDFEVKVNNMKQSSNQEVAFQEIELLLTECLPNNKMLQIDDVKNGKIGDLWIESVSDVMKQELNKISEDDDNCVIKQYLKDILKLLNMSQINLGTNWLDKVMWINITIRNQCCKVPHNKYVTIGDMEQSEEANIQSGMLAPVKETDTKKEQKTISFDVQNCLNNINNSIEDIDIKSALETFYNVSKYLVQIMKVKDYTKNENNYESEYKTNNNKTLNMKLISGYIKQIKESGSIVQIGESSESSLNIQEYAKTFTHIYINLGKDVYDIFGSEFFDENKNTTLSEEATNIRDYLKAFLTQKLTFNIPENYKKLFSNVVVIDDIFMTLILRDKLRSYSREAYKTVCESILDNLVEKFKNKKQSVMSNQQMASTISDINVSSAFEFFGETKEDYDIKNNFKEHSSKNYFNYIKQANDILVDILDVLDDDNSNDSMMERIESKIIIPSKPANDSSVATNDKFKKLEKFLMSYIKPILDDALKHLDTLHLHLSYDVEHLKMIISQTLEEINKLYERRGFRFLKKSLVDEMKQDDTTERTFYETINDQQINNIEGIIKKKTKEYESMYKLFQYTEEQIGTLEKQFIRNMNLDDSRLGPIGKRYDDFKSFMKKRTGLVTETTGIPSDSYKGIAAKGCNIIKNRLKNEMTFKQAFQSILKNLLSVYSLLNNLVLENPDPASSTSVSEQTNTETVETADNEQRREEQTDTSTSTSVPEQTLGQEERKEEQPNPQPTNQFNDTSETTGGGKKVIKSKYHMKLKKQAKTRGKTLNGQIRKKSRTLKKKRNRN